MQLSGVAAAGGQRQRRRAPRVILSAQPLARLVDEDLPELLMITEPACEELRALRRISGAPAWARSVAGASASATPITLMPTTAIATAAAMPVTNCLVLIAMFASVPRVPMTPAYEIPGAADVIGITKLLIVQCDLP